MPTPSQPKTCDRWWGKAHDWGTWNKTGEFELERTRISNGMTRKVGTVIYQQRTCKTCGFIEINQQKIEI